MINKNKQVMKRAWVIARRGQKQFGGKVSEYLSEAMKMAWNIVKNLKEDTQEMIENKLNKYQQVIFEMVSAKGVYANVKVWSKNGKNRLYINNNFIEVNGFFEIVKAEENARNENERTVFNQLLNQMGGVA